MVGLAGNRKVAIVHRLYPWEEEDNLDELEDLCRTAEYEVVYRLVQHRFPHPVYNIGPSKLRDLKEAVRNLGISKVIFENELKPVQEYNLAKELNVDVITRVRLILEIFTMHATSLESHLQIKLASLRYELPRAKEKVRLAKQGEQPGFHGLGAYEADVYYEEVKRQVVTISKKLEEIKRRKGWESRQRRTSGIPTISLAGYTNAGKSTIFTRLTSVPTEISEAMFTTLTTKRRLTRLDGRPAYVSDTVGFIRNVPTLLISAFMSTLMEIADSDLILLVLDVSDPIEQLRKKLEVSINTLRQIGASGLPMVVALNKIDLLTEDELRERMEDLNLEGLPAVPVSAMTGRGMEELVDAILTHLPNLVKFEAKLEYGDSCNALLEDLYNYGRVESVEYLSDGVRVVAEAPSHLVERVRVLARGKWFEIVPPRSVELRDTS
ncbi:MAG: GTPase HflX [Thaumarchaeota archaeon]|nr:GTPase HflX [Candidatus Calditenuaceae archaeon]MDW8187665.1 GTPase HflX [Nitrososphaerota archaeon]